MTGKKAVMLVERVTYSGEFGYLNSSCIRKSIIFKMFLSSWRDKFTLLWQNSVTDVSVVFRLPSRWAPAWRLHQNLYKFGQKISLHILRKKHCCDLNLGESLPIFTFVLFKILDFII